MLHNLPLSYEKCHISILFQIKMSMSWFALMYPTDKSWRKVQTCSYSCPPLELNWNYESLHTPEISGKGQGKGGEKNDFWASV